jgi:hypothetical protein
MQSAKFAHPAIDQTAYMDAWNKYHETALQAFLKMNTWMFETCRRHYNEIKIINVKSVYLVGSYYIVISQCMVQKT